jgi:hypothetical protein
MRWGWLGAQADGLLAVGTTNVRKNEDATVYAFHVEA